MNLELLITDVAGDLLDGDIDRQETADSLRELAKTLGELASTALFARYGLVGRLIGIAAAKAIAGAFDRFIAERMAKAA